MADVFFGEDIKIYVKKDDPVATSFSASDEITTSIFSFDVSGGEFERDTKPLLGNAQITIDKPQSEIEISMDVAIKSSNSTVWDELLYGSGLTSATRADPVSLGIEASDGTNTYQILFNNVRSVSFEKSMEAGEYLQGTFKFSLAPTDSDGNANVQIGSNVFTVA